MDSYEVLSGIADSFREIMDQGLYVWNNYIGTIFALVSLGMVITTDYKLVKKFLHSDRSLKNWLKLLFYTLTRVFFTLWIYYGIGWVFDAVSFVFGTLWSSLKSVFLFITGTFTRKGLVQFTAGLVVVAFIVATGIALVEKFVPEVERKHRRIYKKIAFFKEKHGKRVKQLNISHNTEPGYIPQVCEMEPEQGTKKAGTGGKRQSRREKIVKIRDDFELFDEDRGEDEQEHEYGSEYGEVDLDGYGDAFDDINKRDWM